MRRVFKHEMAPPFATMTCAGTFVNYGRDPQGVASVWVETGETEQLFEYRIFATGEEIEDISWRHRQSIVERGYVWHLYSRETA